MTTSSFRLCICLLTATPITTAPTTIPNRKIPAAPDIAENNAAGFLIQSKKISLFQKRNNNPVIYGKIDKPLLKRTIP